MSKSDRIQEDMARAARRAERLALRAKERADRKARRATEAAERAEKLAMRAVRQSRRRTREMERSIEDLVDDVTDNWTQKAEDWMDRARDELMGDDDLAENGLYRDKTRGDVPGDDGLSAGRDEGYSARRRHSRARRRRTTRAKVRSFRHRLRNGRPLYRDPEAGKVCGICAGFAEYYEVETWQVRLGAILGLMLIPQITIIGYVIAYFLLDKKPYYRRIIDDVEDVNDEDSVDESMGMQGAGSMRQKGSRHTRAERSRRANRAADVTNGQALRQAKSKFAGLEKRLRSMESHVTDSKFELQREFRKISGEN